MEVNMEDANYGHGGTAVERESTMVIHKAEKTPFDLLAENKGSAEEIVAKLLSMKKEAKANSHSELRELVTQMLLNFVSLRQVNRSILMEEDRVKIETESAKEPVDSTMLQLQNLVYEKNHYVKAMNTCKDFKSKYPDIELVSEQDFFSNAPDSIKRDGIAEDTDHSLMLKRLNYELFQRKELCKLREKLELKKKSLSETVANRKKFLSNLPSQLKSLKKASLPVQQQLGALQSKKLMQQHSTELLPSPLYIIYSQFMAQKEAFAENIEVEIIGSMKDAQTFAREQATKDLVISDVQESLKVEDEEDDEHRRRKHPKKVIGRKTLDEVGIYEAHPLRVILHIYDDESLHPKPAKLVTLEFEYLVKLNVVCVGMEGSVDKLEDSILCNLFPDDTGRELPHQSAKLFLEDGKSFDKKRSLRPYKWAQHLAGIEFLSEISPLLMGSEIQNTVSGKTTVVSGLSLYRQQNRVQTIVQRVRSRIKEQLDLMNGNLMLNYGLRGSVEDIVVCGGPFFGDLQWRLASLPIRFGGLGLYSAMEASSFAFVASRAQSWTLQDHILRDSGVVDMGFEFFGALSKLQASVPSFDLSGFTVKSTVPPKAQHALASAFFGKTVHMMEESFDMTVRQKAIFKCLQSAHSQDFLLAIPIDGLGQCMSPVEYRTILKYRLMIPLFPVDAICPMPNCRRILDVFGEHAVHCKELPGFKYRHDLVRDVLCDVFRRAGISAKKEAPVTFLTDPREGRSTLRPADVLVFGWVGGKHACIDLTGVSPLVCLGNGPFVVGKAALNAASAKVAKHERACIENQHEFLPFAFDTFGFLAPDAVEILKRVQRVLHGNVVSPRSSDVVFRRIGFAIQKGLAAQLVARLPSTSM